MDDEQLRARREQLVKKYGDWTAHNIHLRNDTYTFERTHPKFDAQLRGHGIHLRRIVQIVSDITNQPLNTLRVLDLACLEGLYGIELARHGAEVIGIEAREANTEKSRFARDALALENITVVQDDVRNLSVEKYGYFDVVLCLGILYHLDVPDVFDFVQKMADVCKRVVIIDTHVGLTPNKSYVYKGEEYRGRIFSEHAPSSTKEERLKSLWASVDNEESFWFTRPSLFNLLSRAGFSSVYTCQNPAVPGQWIDRDTLVAVKGTHCELASTPVVNSLPVELWAEDSQVGLHPSQQQHGPSISKRIIRRSRRLLARLFAIAK